MASVLIEDLAIKYSAAEILFILPHYCIFFNKESFLLYNSIEMNVEDFIKFNANEQANLQSS